MNNSGGLGDNLNATSASLDKLMKQFKNIDGIVTKLDKKLKTLGQGSSTGFTMGTDGAQFSNFTGRIADGIKAKGTQLAGAASNIPGIGGLAATGIEMAAAQLAKFPKTAGAAFDMMPNVNATMTRMSQGYNVAVMNGFSGANNEARAGLQRGTLAMMGNGLTAPGSDMQFAGIMASSGIAYSSNPNSAYAVNARQTANLAKYLNIDNEVAARSMANVTSGATSAALMSNLGIMTSDPQSGKMYSFKDIAAQFESRVVRPGAKLTAENVMDSYHRGFLGTSLANSGFDDTQQQMILQSLLQRAKTGKGIDFADNAQMDKLAADNPMLSQYKMNASDTQQMQKGEGAYKQGVDAAVSGLMMLNNVAGDLAATFGALKSGVETFSGHRAGSGFMDMVMNIVSGGSQTMGTAFATGGMSAISSSGSYSARSGGVKSTSVATDVSTANAGGGSSVAATVASGSVSTNQKKQVTNKKFSCIKPVNSGSITADYGAKGDQWEGGTHKAIDYGVSEGTPVVAAHSGVVRHDTSQKQLGNYIKLWYDDRDYATGYAHLQKFVAGDGQYVKQGELIAYSGNTGTNTSGAHLHFEVWKNGQRVNPHDYLNGSSASKTPTSSADSSTGSSNSGSSASSEKTALPISLTARQQISFSQGKLSSSAKADYYTGVGGGSSTVAVDPLSGGSYATTSSGKGYLPVDSGGSSQSHPLVGGAPGTRGGSNVVIHLTIGRATDAEARQFAEKVKSYIEEDRLISNMGRS